MEQPIEFQARLLKHPGINACYVEFPFDVEEIFGIKGQVKVKAYIDGKLYRGSLANMGGRCHTLGITKAVREKIKKGEGDIVQIVLQQDLEERTVVIPDDIQAALDEDENVLRFFNTLSFTNKKEYVNWITSAKKEETRKKRMSELIKRLHEGKKNLNK